MNSSSDSIRWKSSQTRRLLPIPGTPTSVTSCSAPAARAVERIVQQAHLELAADELGGAVVRDVDTQPRARRDRLPGRHRLRLALGGDALGRRGTRSRARSRDASPAPTRTPLTGAADCRRAAVLTTSPATSASPSAAFASSETSASPVLTAARISSPSSTSASRTASAARTARSGSSSCATGAPKTAITASPMNFSTVPPKRSSSSRARAWYGASVARTSSGSAFSERAVCPTRSTKTMLTTLRSSRAWPWAVSGEPHEAQNRASSGLSRPHVLQTITG